METSTTHPEFVELRTKIERTAGPIPDVAWGCIDVEYLEAADARAPHAFDDLLTRVKQLQAVHRDGQASRREDSDQRGVRLGRRGARGIADVERERSNALEAVIGGFARKDADVIAFRSKYVGELTVTGAQVKAALLSPALACLSQATVKKLGFPIFGHTAQLAESTHLPGATAPLRRRELLKIRWKTGKMHKQHVTWPPYRRTLMLPQHITDAVGRPIHRIDVIPESYLDDCRIIAERIAQRFDWVSGDALWFLFTRKAPRYRAHGVYSVPAAPPGRPYGFITIEASPWMSADSIKKLFLDAQIRLLGKKKRQLTIEKLALLQFVEHQRAGAADPPTWEQMFGMWRRTPHGRHPAPPKTWKGLWREYHRVRANLLGETPSAQPPVRRPRSD